jgi:hypothetical protein
VVHQAAAGTAVGGVIQHRNAAAAQHHQGIGPTEGLQLALVLTQLTTLRQMQKHNVLVKDLPKVLSKWVQAEYLTCKVTGVPNFQEITWNVDGEQRDMYRLLLPLSLDSGSIDHLVSSVVYKKPHLYESLAYVKA